MKMVLASRYRGYYHIQPVENGKEKVTKDTPARTGASHFAARRRQAFKLAGRKEAVDAVYVTRRIDVGYLTGFTGDDSAVLFGKDWSVLITDFRFGEQAPGECPGSEIHIRPRKIGLEESMAKVAGDQRVASIGFQSTDLTVDRHTRLKHQVKRRRLVPLEDILSTCRAIKDDEEIRATRRAVEIAERAFLELLSTGVKGLVGRTEISLARELDMRMRDAGAERPAFDIIVASGANGSMCHYVPSDRKLKRGDSVLVDWGAQYGGYRSDITRVFFLGSVPEKLREIYPIVVEANEASTARIRHGAKLGQIDAVARKVIDDAGFGEQFGHGLGHGVGREIHEQPRFAADSKAPLKRNMIVTIEPGIYLPGVGGVRIEDDILVTADGHEVLTRLPHALEKYVLR